MAHAIIRLTPIVDNIAGECPTCGFDSLRRVRMAHLTTSGVGILADVTGCGRCADQGEAHA